jgi:tripeptidyl-peptidase-2
MNENDFQQNSAKLELDLRCRTECSENWVTAPQFFTMNNEGRTITVRVDPGSLSPGLHFASVSVFDSEKPEMGALVKVPVTVLKPEVNPPEIAVMRFSNIVFQPGTIVRKFINVPSDANIVELIVSSKGRDTPARFIVHTIQLNPQSRYTQFEHEYAFSMTASGVQSDTLRHQKVFPVIPGVSLEICLAQFWSSLDSTIVSLDVKFHSILCSTSQGTQSSYGVGRGSGGALLVNSGIYGFTRLDMSSPLGQETILPAITFEHLQKEIRPTTSQISPKASRDVLMNGCQIHELILTYSITISESTSVFFRLPKFHNVLYDSNADNFALCVYDKNKKQILFQDVYGKEKSLDEGEYTVKVQITSPAVDFLESLKSSSLLVRMKLAKSLSPPIAKSLGELNASSKIDKFVLKKGDRAAVWVGDIEPPKEAKQGDMLLGKLDVLSGELKLSETLYPVVYFVPSAFKPETFTTGTKLPEKSDSEKFDEAVTDLEISWISKMKSLENKKELIEKLEPKYGSNNKFIKERLLNFIAQGKNEGDKPILSLKLSQERIAYSKKIIELIDEKAVAVYFGVHHDLSQGHEVDKILNDEMNLKKEILKLCYRNIAESYRTAILFKEQVAAEIEESFQAVDLDSHDVAYIMFLFNDSLRKYGSLISATPHKDESYFLELWIWQQRRKGLHGLCLQKISSYLGDKKNISKDPEMYERFAVQKREILGALGFDAWKELEDEWRIVNFPKIMCRF